MHLRRTSRRLTIASSMSLTQAAAFSRRRPGSKRLAGSIAVSGAPAECRRRQPALPGFQSALPGFQPALLGIRPSSWESSQIPRVPAQNLGNTGQKPSAMLLRPGALEEAPVPLTLLSQFPNHAHHDPDQPRTPAAFPHHLLSPLDALVPMGEPHPGFGLETPWAAP